MSAITDAQFQALQKVNDILREHFEASVLTVLYLHPDDDKKESTQTMFHGGYVQALGLAEESRLNLRECRASQPGKDE